MLGQERGQAQMLVLEQGQGLGQQPLVLELEQQLEQQLEQKLVLALEQKLGQQLVLTCSGQMPQGLEPRQVGWQELQQVPRKVLIQGSSALFG